MKIKIFVDAHVFDSGFEGTTSYLHNLYTQMVQDDSFEITLAANNVSNLRTLFPHPAFRFERLNTSSSIIRLLVTIPRLLRLNNYDYAHFQYITPVSKPCKFVNTIHDVLFLDYPHYFPRLYRLKNSILFRMSARNSEIICTVSAFSKAALIRHFNLPENRVHLTPNAVNAETLAGGASSFADTRLNKSYILCVSRFEPRKNQLTLLKAWVELKLYREYQLVFVGRRKDVPVEKFDAYLATLSDDITGRILFYENLSVQQLQGIYRNAALFVYPSFAEGFGIPPLEAAIQGCRVLCSNATSMSDFSFFGDYLFDPSNAEQLKSKMLGILATDNYPAELIRSRILNTYDLHAIAAHFGNLLKEDHSPYIKNDEAHTKA